MVKYIIHKYSRRDTDAPLWTGYEGPACTDGGVEPGRIYDTLVEAQRDCEKLGHHNPVGFTPIRVCADAVVTVTDVYKHNLWKVHDVSSLHWLHCHPGAGWYRYRVEDVISMYRGCKYMVYLEKGAVVDQISYAPVKRCEIQFNRVKLARMATKWERAGREAELVEILNCAEAQASVAERLAEFTDVLVSDWAIAPLDDKYAITPYGKELLALVLSDLGEQL